MKFISRGRKVREGTELPGFPGAARTRLSPSPDPMGGALRWGSVPRTESCDLPKDSSKAAAPRLKVPWTISFSSTRATSGASEDPPAELALAGDNAGVPSTGGCRRSMNLRHLHCKVLPCAVAALSTLILCPALAIAEVGPPGSDVLVYCKRVRGTYTCDETSFARLYATFEEHGVAVSFTTQLPAELAPYHLVILTWLEDDWSVSEISTIADYLAGGARLVVTGEYSDTNDEWNMASNELLVALAGC